MLEVTGICKSFKNKEILNGVNLKATLGTCVGIVGGNGCGKTTLLAILAGVSRPDKGSIRFNGAEAVGNRKLFEQTVAYVPQENPFIPELSAGDNLKLWYSKDKKTMEEDLKHGVANALGLPEFLMTPAGKLSGGQKKRLSIAAALSNHASVLILDEPGAALDLAAKEEIITYLKEYVKQGKIVIITSHEMGELALCDEMYVLKNGMLKQISTGLTSEKLVEQF